MGLEVELMVVGRGGAVSVLARLEARSGVPVWRSIDGRASSSMAISIGTSTVARQRLHSPEARRQVGDDEQAAVGAGEPDVPLDRIGLATGRRPSRS